MTVQPGRMLSHYRLVEKIGEGGMGIVWKAWDEHLDREVAIKVLPPGTLSDESARQQFRKEARALSRVNHPNIATVHDFDTQDDVDFLVMEYIPGITLTDRLARGPLVERDVLRLGIQLSEGLAAAHDQGILHRDLKPGNLRLMPDDRLKILDFGLAKLLEPVDEDAPTETMTRAGTIKGTLAYMAPEQLRGDQVDGRTDIYAAGAVLYEMATGERVHPETQRVQLIDAILHGEPSSPREIQPGLSPEFERVVLKAANTNPEERHPSARHLKDELELLSTLTPVLSRRAPSRLSTRAVFGAGAVTLIGLVLLALWLGPLIRDRRSPARGELDRPRIVVLPFENLGPAEHAYFADGVTEEITSRLAVVEGLGVISRNSAVRYAQSDKSIEQIGQELSVGFVLAGTVRWAPSEEGRDRVRITPQLIRVAEDTQLWADTYDQVIDDIFEVQSSIAQTVVQQLGVVLQERELAAVEIRPTDSLDAYHAYLRGLHHASQPHFTVSNWERVLESFQQAVTLDSEFAKAWTELARAHAKFYYYQADLSEERKRLARRATDRAVELAPDEPDAHLALGYYYHWVEQNRQRALEEFALAERALPNDVGVLQARGALLQSMGRWAEAQQSLERAVGLSPRDASPAIDLALVYYVTRQYQRALECSNNAIAVASSPGSETWGYLTKAYVYWSWKGALPEARAALEHVSLDHDFAVWSWFWQEMYAGRHPEALERLELAPEGWIRNKIAARPTPLLAGLALQLMSDSEQSHDAYESAREILERALENQPEDPRLRGSLGIAYAALGRKEDAIREGMRAVELYPISRDAFYGVPYVLDLAYIYTLVDEHEKACDQLESLLAVPSWVSVPFLGMDPRWDRLRDHPRFQSLLDEYRAPAAVASRP
jgi:serine/threonine protein kinase/tetratricopeptide (TPR) repeat protein